MSKLHFSALAFDPMTVDAITRILIPISTFILGIIFTLILKHYEQNRANFRSEVEEVVELTNAWYNQLHALFVKIEGGASEGLIETLMYDYVNNREILPKLRLSKAILNKHRKGEKLVDGVDRFLALVITPIDGRVGPPGCSYPPTDGGGKLDLIAFRLKLEQLDDCLNRVVTEAAKLL